MREFSPVLNAPIKKTELNMLIKDFLLYLLLIIFCASICALSVSFILPRLKNRASQPIYEDGPKWHKSKDGTPTMGGIAFIIASIIALVLLLFILPLFTNDRSVALSLFISLLYSVLNAGIGIFDDLKKIFKKQNKGLGAKDKLILQFLLAVLFLMARQHFFGDGTALYTPFGSLELGILYYPFAIILLLGIINCANLTDGLDGLASSVALTIGICIVLIFPQLSTASIIGAMLSGISLGFLFFNVNPAKIFMGDTGSLFLGALVVSAAFALKKPLVSVSLGLLYVTEGISVILQVVYYKATKKRLFKMAPIHHHLEKCGMDENKICIWAIIFTLLSSLLTYLLIT